MSHKNFCDVCPRRLGKPPSDPCSLALENVSSQSDKSDLDKGCPWGINSAEHSYCFWNLSKELHANPLSEREVCNLLGITNSKYQEIYHSAISKLKCLKGTELMDDFISSVQDSLANEVEDNSVYLPDNFRSKGDVSDLLEQNQDDPDKKEKPKKKMRKGYGMPMHRDQKKVDLFGTYSKRTLERIKNEKKIKDK